MKLHWNNCQGDVWCKLSTVNLSHSHFDTMEGVYVIWHGGANAKTVKVGQGIIRDRLTAHRIDANIQAYASLTLYVTWAQVGNQNRDGVEVFLGNRLAPLVAVRFPDVAPIEVNFPW